MKFFLDNCLRPGFADALNALDGQNQYESLLRKFKRGDVPDLEWIPALADEGDWIIVSADRRITRNPAEKKAFCDSGLTGFFFASPFQNKAHWEQTIEVVRWMPIIIEHAKRHPAGHGFNLPMNGSAPKLFYTDSATRRR